MLPFGTNISPLEMLSLSVAGVVFVSVLLAVVYSLWGGFLLITSGGNEEKVKPAVNHIRHAFLGLIVLVIILFVIPKVLDLFGLTYGDSLSPKAIFTNIRIISSKLFGTKSGIDSTDSTDNLDSLPSDFSDL